MNDVDGKLLNGIKSMYANSLTYVRIKRGVRASVSEFTVVLEKVVSRPLGSSLCICIQS